MTTRQFDAAVHSFPQRPNIAANLVGSAADWLIAFFLPWLTRDVRGVQLSVPVCVSPSRSVLR